MNRLRKAKWISIGRVDAIREMAMIVFEERPARAVYRCGGYPSAVGAARRARLDGHEIRLRRRRLRDLCTSVRGAWKPLREAGAIAREVLVCADVKPWV
jgi:hypothetical protein